MTRSLLTSPTILDGALGREWGAALRTAPVQNGAFVVQDSRERAKPMAADPDQHEQFRPDPARHERTKQGADDFDAFYTATSPSLLHHLHAFTGNLSEAQDCVQEAYAKAWVRWDEVSHYDQPLAWVRTVAVRQAISRFRKVKNALVAQVRAGVPDPAPDLSPDGLVLLDALRTLPTPQRQALVLHYLVDLPVAEVARNLGVPEGTVKARLHRGRTSLAAVLGPQERPSSRRSR